MRQTCIFSGSSHPKLVEAICERLGKAPDKVALKKFANGETSVEIQTSVRDQDVFIVQSGSSKTNDNVMELLIMINACKGGSARSITAVMPYFPYSRQSKRKSHRGAITARMVANLMHVAGVNHVITIDLHATQSQGFFKCPVDNLIAEPILAKWIKNQVKDWKEAVVVSKNPGGTKRVTSLADALKLSFGIVTTDTRRPNPNRSLETSTILGSAIMGSMGLDGTNDRFQGSPTSGNPSRQGSAVRDYGDVNGSDGANDDDVFAPRRPSRIQTSGGGRISPPSLPLTNGNLRTPSSESQQASSGLSLNRVQTALGTTGAHPELTYDSDGESGDDFGDERARDVVTGRLIQGHIVEDDHPAPSPMISAMSPAHPLSQMQRANSDDDPPDNMMSSFMSAASSRIPEQGLGGTADAAASDEEEEAVLEDPGRETTITLVGNVRDRPVFVVDDIIDKAASWIAAAETAVKRGGATSVYCMATHGLFGGDSLRELQDCKEIDRIVVTNAFPIPEEKSRGITKLVTLDVSYLLAEAIRRNHHGESISQLFMHYD
ncbi:putative N-terminal domain of ribose phosphate pyrophosphokinase [Elsinoe australis]|uniref:Ribose-phosphate pyrophosphokinase 1 n=1 Tax=Elsinoe australis TaxID=40998 RepID=A0A4U7B5I6_9PEZI|nr:putative N-terminal domain of ribose phosphate pyrophosphokinase [Elsinoe australis]